MLVAVLQKLCFFFYSQARPLRPASLQLDHQTLLADHASSCVCQFSNPTETNRIWKSFLSRCLLDSIRAIFEWDLWRDPMSPSYWYFNENAINIKQKQQTISSVEGLVLLSHLMLIKLPAFSFFAIASTRCSGIVSKKMLHTASVLTCAGWMRRTRAIVVKQRSQHNTYENFEPNKCQMRRQMLTHAWCVNQILT